tara:strand:- start:1006 stop:2034 length:1029 start_codon:yes stop_codon:yes gene_type:complete
MREIKSNKKNIFTKLFIKMCRLLGFEIIDQSNFTAPISNKSLNETLSIPGERSITLPLGEVKITRKIKSFDVILRTCMTVNMLTQSKKRVFEEEKEEYTKRTLISIIKSINHAKSNFKEIKFKIYVIDYNSKKDQIDILNNILKNSKIEFEIIDLDFNNFSKEIKKINEENKEVTSNQKSNMSNIHQSILLSKDKCEDLTYFVEDDYLHQLEAISEILFTYEKVSSLTNNELIICPTDYPYLYVQPNNTNLIIGENRHWRKIDQTLCSFVMSKKIIENYTDELISMCKFEHYPFEKPLHKIYKQELCISPIPSLSVHFTNINSIYGLSPNVDWKKLWKENES